MPITCQFRVIGALQGGVVLCASARPEERALLWSAPPPLWAMPAHPHLARRIEATAGQLPRWLEPVPAGLPMAALSPPLSPNDAAALFASLCDALSALHEAGMGHGALLADRIWLDRSGRPTLCGAVGGDAAADLVALEALWQRWCPRGPLLVSSTAADAASALRAWLSVTAALTPLLPAQIHSSAQPIPDDAESLTLRIAGEPGSVDEVGHDLGPDEVTSGLLDPMTWSGVTGEPTSELTGELTGGQSEDTRINAPRAALMARLLGSIHSPPPLERFAAADGTPVQAIRALITSETLDPLPCSDGLPPQLGALVPRTAPEWEEHTATAIDIAPVAAPEVTPDSPPSRSPAIGNRLLAVAVLLALAAGVAGAWLLTRAL